MGATVYYRIQEVSQIGCYFHEERHDTQSAATTSATATMRESASRNGDLVYCRVLRHWEERGYYGSREVVTIFHRDVA